MRISVVIPARDEVEEIAGAIESATGPTLGGPERAGPALGDPAVDVWVVDGGSRDGTRERAAEWGARVLRSAPGRARQLQLGVEASDGEVVLFLHADTRLSQGWREAVDRCLADAGTCGGAFRFCFSREGFEAAGPLSLRVVEWGVRLRLALFGLPYGDQAIFVRRKVLDAIGGVPQVPVMEDLDLVRAMKRSGRVAKLTLPAQTSPRRYARHGVWRTLFRHWLAAAGWAAGLDRERLARWVAR